MIHSLPVTELTDCEMCASGDGGGGIAADGRLPEGGGGSGAGAGGGGGTGAGRSGISAR